MESRLFSLRHASGRVMMEPCNDEHHASSHSTIVYTHHEPSMMRHFFPVHTFLLTLFLVVSLQSSVAWLGPAGHLFQHTAAALVLSATLMGSPAPQPPMLGKELQSNLQPPTENRPQIQIPRNLQQSPDRDDKKPIVEGATVASDDD